MKPEQFAQAERISPMLDRFMEERAKHFGDIDLADPGADRLTTDQKILRDKSGHTNTGGNTIHGSASFLEQTEEEKKKEEERNVKRALRSFSANLKDLEESYSLAASALKLSEQYNAHAEGLLPGAQKAAAEAEAEAQEKFEQVEDKAITARTKDGQVITVKLNEYGLYVGEDGKVLDDQDIIVEDKEVLAADAAIDDAQVKDHVASVREFQVAELESMRKYEEMERQKLEAEQRKQAEIAQRQADPNSIKGIDLKQKFGDAVQDNVAAVTEPALVPKPQPAATLGMAP